MKYYLFVWTNVLRDYSSGVIFGTGESVEDVRRKFVEDGSEQFHEALWQAPDFIREVSTNDAVNYKYGGG